MLHHTVNAWETPRKRSNRTEKGSLLFCKSYILKKKKLWYCRWGQCTKKKTYQISWRALPRHNRLIVFGPLLHCLHSRLSYTCFSLPNERCGGLRTEHPGSVCVSCVCVCPSQLSHSVSSFPCVCVDWPGQSFCAGEKWVSLRYSLLVWPHPSLCYYFVPQTLHLHHLGWCFGRLPGQVFYPESFYCTEKSFHPLMLECACCQYWWSLLRSVHVHGCCDLLCVMALAFQVFWVLWHQSLYLFEGENKPRQMKSFKTIIVEEILLIKRLDSKMFLRKEQNRAKREKKRTENYTDLQK